MEWRKWFRMSMADAMLAGVPVCVAAAALGHALLPWSTGIVWSRVWIGIGVVLGVLSIGYKARMQLKEKRHLFSLRYETCYWR